MSDTTGPLIIDLQGTELAAEERELLQHPMVGGLIFFGRNIESREQIRALCRDVRRVRKQPLLLTVDQEGGRVQRLRQGFTRLPSMGQIGRVYQDNPSAGLELAAQCGTVMASELLAVGIDLSFAPVLDVDKGISTVIGDRAFAREQTTVVTLAKALTQGMRAAGMAAVGKHFPGHGSVAIDSHLDLPVDNRTFAEIVIDDLIPFAELIQAGIESVMAAHILFPAIDDKPVGFSSYWLQTVLRQQLAFKGIVFSDALDMHGADVAGGFPDRVVAALEAGCDMALICNQRESVIKTLDGLPTEYRRVTNEKVNRLRGNFTCEPSVTAACFAALLAAHNVVTTA